MINNADKENFKVELCRTDAGNIAPCVRLVAGTDNVKMRDGNVMWYPTWEEVEFLWDCMKTYEKNNSTSARPVYESETKRPTSMTQQSWQKGPEQTPPQRQAVTPPTTASYNPHYAEKTNQAPQGRPQTTPPSFSAHTPQKREGHDLVDHVIAKQKKEEEQTNYH